jgi:hypothetical protein
LRKKGNTVERKKPNARMDRKRAVNKADKYASLDIRLDGKCVLSDANCKGDLVCGHLFSRVAYSTRWSEANLYPLCSFHNIRMEDDPVIARRLLEYAEQLWGEAAIEELHHLYETARPVKTWLINEHAELWEAKYKKHLFWKSKEVRDE